MIEKHKAIPIKKMLIRPLKVGEQFKVLPPSLNLRNSNEHMRNLRGQWLTIMNTRPDNMHVDHWAYYPAIYRDPLYKDEARMVDYSVREHEDGFIEHWYDYHMDIYETNLRLIHKESKGTELLAPNLPTI